MRGEKEGIDISVGGRGDFFGLLKVGSSRPLASAICWKVCGGTMPYVQDLKHKGDRHLDAMNNNTIGFGAINYVMYLWIFEDHHRSSSISRCQSQIVAWRIHLVQRLDKNCKLK